MDSREAIDSACPCESKENRLDLIATMMSNKKVLDLEGMALLSNDAVSLKSRLGLEMMFFWLLVLMLTLLLI